MTDSILIRRIAAFTDRQAGGNAAGVAIVAALPSETAMQRIAREVALSETVFAAPQLGAWRVRYFSPETEIPFCGHATIALGAALSAIHGNGSFRLLLNDAEITVAAGAQEGIVEAALDSPSTRSMAADGVLVQRALSLFDYSQSELDSRLPPALAHAGASHLIIPLNSRAALAAMRYALDEGRSFMRANHLVTIAFVYAESARRFHARNAFASGGVYEDPATGAAAAALAGYLRDVGWPHGGAIEIIQGEDLGARSLIRVELSDARGSSVRVHGATRLLSAPRRYSL
jgi:PhzF family phenazine biosynthesis protein